MLDSENIGPVWAIVGPSCSGKTECGRSLRHNGWLWIEASTPMTAEVPLDLPQLERLAAIEQFFSRRGDEFLAHRVVDQCRHPSPTPTVVTGFRKVAEIATLKHSLPAKVLAIDCPLDRRFSFSTHRRRQDSPLSLDDFARLSAWEYSLGLGRIMYEADVLLVNNGPLSDLIARVQRHLST